MTQLTMEQLALVISNSLETSFLRINASLDRIDAALDQHHAVMQIGFKQLNERFDRIEATGHRVFTSCSKPRYLQVETVSFREIPRNLPRFSESRRADSSIEPSLSW